MTQLEDLPRIPKGKRLTPKEQQEFSADVATVYNKHHISIKRIAQQTGRAYGTIHALLLNVGVTLRPRGGVTNGPPRRASR
ncbi:helix-turn-helix domain-containing protein [Streptomyces olivoreticuli]